MKLYKDLARAMATGHGQEGARLGEQLSSDDESRNFKYVTALFIGMVVTHLGENPGKAEIDQFIDRMRHDYRKMEPPFKSLAMEGVVRAVYGEAHLLDEIPANEQLRLQYMAIREITHHNESVSSKLDAYLDDAEVIAGEWEAEDT